MTAATFSLGLSTLLACVWPKGETDHTPTEGLALGEYRLWPLWIWIYCIIWWFLQDIAKVFTYRAIIKYDVFGFVSGTMVNVRGVNQIESAAPTSLARQSVGLVQSKLLNLQVDDALNRVSAMDKGGDKSLARVSVEIQLARKSIQVARTSLANVGESAAGQAALRRGSMEGLVTAVGRIEDAAAGVADDAHRAELERRLEGIRQTADDLASAGNVLQRLPQQ
jgi:H+-transporting ATPase